MDERIKSKPAVLYSVAERHEIIKEYLSGDCTKQQIWEKYTGEKQEHGSFLRWLRNLGYEDKKAKSSIFRPINSAMTKTEDQNQNTLNSCQSDFERLQLEKRILELEKQLKEAEMKAIAFSTMVDIAEKEFKIPIRKKYKTKP